MKDLMQKIQAQALSSRPCYLVALIESEGSTPRTSGAYMLVGEKGLLYGTIGGGGMEYAAQQLAQQRLRCGGGSFVKTFDLSPAQAWPAVEAVRCSFVTCLWGKKRGTWQRKLLVQ